MTAMPCAVSSRMIRNRLPTSSWASTALGSSMMISRASCDSARAMLTICLPAAGSDRTIRPAGSRAWPSRPRISRGLACHRAPADEAEPARLVAEEHVLRHRQVVDQVEFLVDGGDAGLHRGLRVGEADRLAEPLDLPGVGLVRAGEHLDQRGLAGAVLAEQAVHLAGPHLQLHAVERAYAGEGLHHVGEPQNDIVAARRSRLGSFAGMDCSVMTPPRRRRRWRAPRRR